MPRGRFSIDERAIRALYDLGYNDKEIYDSLKGVSRYGVSYWRYRNNLPCKRTPNSSHKTMIDRQKLLDLYQSGMPIMDIAQELNMKYSTVLYHIRRSPMRLIK